MQVLSLFAKFLIKCAYKTTQQFFAAVLRLFDALSRVAQTSQQPGQGLTFAA